MLQDILNYFLEHLGYWTIFWGMFIEGSFIPFPSELIVCPAAYRAAAGDLNVMLVVVVATLGALAGSSLNYVLAYYLGRPLVYSFANSRFGHLCLLNQKKIEQSENFFNKHGVVATLTGRLLPGIRQLISIPAGLAKMKIWKFTLYTFIGAGLWNCVLATLGYYLHSFVPKEQLTDKIEEYNGTLQLAFVGIIGVVVLFFIIKEYANRRNRRPA